MESLSPIKPTFSALKYEILHPGNTVDGRNPAPVEVGSFSHYLQGFILPRWLAGFLNHQQYRGLKHPPSQKSQLKVKGTKLKVKGIKLKVKGIVEGKRYNLCNKTSDDCDSPWTGTRGSELKKKELFVRHTESLSFGSYNLQQTKTITWWIYGSPISVSLSGTFFFFVC